MKGDPLDLLNPLPGELAVIHYVAPFGRQKKVFAPVGEEYVRKAEGMVASAEVLSTDIVALYLRWAEEPEEKELLRLARNGPGADSPNETLKRMIDELRERGRR